MKQLIVTGLLVGSSFFITSCGSDSSDTIKITPTSTPTTTPSITPTTTPSIATPSNIKRGEKFFETLEKFNRYYTDSSYQSKRVIYVSPNGSGDGRASTPTSVESAFQSVGAGEEIRFLSGEYNGCWELNDEHSGTYDAPIVLKAEPNVTINCCNSGRASCFNFEFSNYVAVDGFHLKGGKYAVRTVGGYATNEHQKGIAILNNHGEGQSRDPFFSGGSDWIIVENNIAHGAGSGDGHGIYLSNGGDWMLVKNNNLYDNSSSDFQINADPISTCEEEGIDYTDSRCDGSALDGLGRGISEFILVENNYFHHSEIGPNFTSVRNSIIHNNIIGFYNRHNTSFWQETDNPKLGSSNNIIEHNLFIGENNRHLLQLINSSKNNKVTNNVLLGIDGSHTRANSSTLLVEQDSSTQNSNVFKSNYLAGGYFENYTPSASDIETSNFNSNWFQNFPLNGNGDISSFKPTNTAPFLDKGELQATTPRDMEGTARFNPVDLGPWRMETKSVETTTNTTTDNQATQYVSYMLNGKAEIIEAKNNGAVINVSNHLDTLSNGEESWINISPNGEWIVMESSRLNSECEAWACLIYGKRDLSEFHAITDSSGGVIHPEGFSAISSDGKLIVAHMSENGRSDLYVSKNINGTWSQPQSITSASASNNNKIPALSQDGKEVIFNCGDNICMVNSDGSHLKTLINLSDKPTGEWSKLRHADFDPNGDIIFEAEDGTERIWRYRRDTSTFSVINSSHTNDNSPCVLSNREIASLWLNRPNNSNGVHELKVMSPLGLEYMMSIQNRDISDVGIGCGGR